MSLLLHPSLFHSLSSISLFVEFKKVPLSHGKESLASGIFLVLNQFNNNCWVVKQVVLLVVHQHFYQFHNQLVFNNQSTNYLHLSFLLSECVKLSQCLPTEVWRYSCLYGFLQAPMKNVPFLINNSLKCDDITLSFLISKKWNAAFKFSD